MKANKFKSLRGHQGILLSIAVTFSVCQLVFYGSIELADTSTYISAWDNYLSMGVLDPCRTPVYPILLGLGKIVMGENYKMGIVIFQHFLCILSVLPFYMIANKCTKSRNLSFWFTMSYFFIADITYNSYIMTESITCTIIVLIVYTSIRLKEAHNVNYGIILFFFLTIVVFLRPAQVYVLLILTCLWFFIWLSEGFTYAKIGLTATLLVYLIVGCYVSCFNKQYGFYGFSDVSDINQYYIMRAEKMMMYSNDSIFDSEGELKTSVLWNEIQQKIKNGDYKSFHSEVSSAVSENRIFLLRKCIGRLFRAKDSLLFEHGTSYLFSSIYLFLPHLNFVYLLLLLYPLLYSKSDKDSSLSLMSAIIYFFVLSNVIIVLIGAQSGWGRLIYPSFPLWLLMVCQMMSRFGIMKK